MVVPLNVADPRIAKALAHPVRVEILRALEEGETSPVEVAKAAGYPLGVCSYHFNALAELGLIEASRSTRRRGAVQTHWLLSAGAAFPDALRQLPRLARASAAASALEPVAEAIGTAIVEGGLEADEAAVVHIALELDARGRKEAAREIRALDKRLARIAHASRARASARTVVRRWTVILMLFRGNQTDDVGADARDVDGALDA